MFQNNRGMKKLPIFNYHITNQGGERLDVYIEGSIVDAESQEMMREWFGDETSVSFKSFRTDILNSGLKNIRIIINCFGGQIGETEAICSFIEEIENSGYSVEGKGVGFVCSSATKILSKIKNSKISKNSWYMIHNASMYFGYMEVNTAEKATATLRKFNDNVRDFYVDLTQLDASQIQAWMDAETWFTGEEAVKNGFVKALIEDDYTEEYKPINKTDWHFKNQNPLNVYNSLVDKPKPVNNNENLIQNLDMKNLATLIGNAINSALANFNIVPKEGGEGVENQFTPETITNSVTKALEGYEPPAPTDEQIQTAITNFFTNGLPENIVTQITNTVKPVDFKESEDWTKISNRIEDLEKKVVNRQTPVQTPSNEDSKKYDGVSFE